MPRRGSAWRVPQGEGHADIVADLIGRLPVALPDTVIEAAHTGLTGHVNDAGAILGGGTQGKRDARLAGHVTDGELADGLVAGGGLGDLRGAEARLFEFAGREQIRGAQGVIAFL